VDNLSTNNKQQVSVRQDIKGDQFMVRYRYMRKFVLDTNLFFNMEPGLGIGKKTQDVIVSLTKHIKKKKEKEQAEFYMPPRVTAELLSFFEDKSQAFLIDFLGEIQVKSPDISKITFPADVFYKLIQDVRERSYRGLTIAQEEVEHSAKMMSGEELKDKKEYEIRLGPVIKTLRERYRQATRAGFLDSVADLDLIVLAKEQNAELVTTDEGVIAWARIFGITEMPAQTFGQWMSQQ